MLSVEKSKMLKTKNYNEMTVVKEMCDTLHRLELLDFFDNIYVGSRWEIWDLVV
jgi:hypothetical protein